MLIRLAYFQILSKPLIMYLGILTLTFFVIAASIPPLSRSKFKIPFKWHHRMVATAFIFAMVHAILGLSIYFSK